MRFANTKRSLRNRPSRQSPIFTLSCRVLPAPRNSKRTAVIWICRKLLPHTNHSLTLHPRCSSKKVGTLWRKLTARARKKAPAGDFFSSCIVRVVSCVTGGLRRVLCVPASLRETLLRTLCVSVVRSMFQSVKIRAMCGCIEQRDGAWERKNVGAFPDRRPGGPRMARWEGTRVTRVQTTEGRNEGLNRSAHPRLHPSTPLHIGWSRSSQTHVQPSSVGVHHQSENRQIYAINNPCSWPAAGLSLHTCRLSLSISGPAASFHPAS